MTGKPLTEIKLCDDHYTKILEAVEGGESVPVLIGRSEWACQELNCIKRYTQRLLLYREGG
jgi:hypothetical protein